MNRRLPGAHTARHLLVALLAGLLAAGASLAMPQRHLVQGWLIDITAAARANLSGVPPLDSESVVVVTVGERTLDSPELSGIPRPLFTPVWAALIRKALDAGAHSLAFDFILDYDAGRMRIGGEAPLKDWDRDFLALLHAEGRKGRILLGRSSGILPAPRFVKVGGADHLGMVEAPLGPGNVVRRVTFRLTDAGGKQHPTLSALALGSIGVAPPDHAWVVPPGPLDTLPNVELIDVLRCSDAAALGRVFDGRLVFVGSALAGEDRLKGTDRLMPAPPAAAPPDDAAPCLLAPERHRTEAGTVPGVFLHAAAADSVLSGWAPRPLGTPWRLLLTGVAASVAVGFAMLGRLRWALAGVLLLATGVFAAGIALLSTGHLLASSDPLLAVPLAFVGGWIVRNSVLDRQARLIRREFGRYLSPELISRMVDSDRLPELGGESRPVTVMFADLSGFTRLSGDVPEKQLFQVLNEYLDRCAGIVQAHGGYVDKFVGDAVMAIWNAPADLPDHVRAAVGAGLEMARAVAEIHDRHVAAGRPALKIKVAINTGPALVGNVGSRERMNYTVVGSAVNVASRMEDLPGVFRTPVILGETTARIAATEFVLLPVARVSLDGISEPMEIHAPLAPAGAAEAPLLALVEDYRRATSLAEEGRLRQAIEIWSRLAALDWPGAGPAAVMVERACERRGAELGPAVLVRLNGRPG